MMEMMVLEDIFRLCHQHSGHSHMTDEVGEWLQFVKLH